jgi:hypothetical protein
MEQWHSRRLLGQVSQLVKMVWGKNGCVGAASLRH